MSEYTYTVHEADEKTSEKYRKQLNEERLALKEKIAAMKEAGRDSFMDNPGDFDSNKKSLFDNLDVFIYDDRVLFIDFDGGRVPDGFEPVEKVSYKPDLSESKNHPKTPQS